jgi:hypothetical protein
MATFCICLSAPSSQLVVDLPAATIDELVSEASTSRFLAGNMARPDEQGCFPGVMIQTNRIQFAFETYEEHLLYSDRSQDRD